MVLYSTDSRHFVLVHGYNTNHEEARGNAAEFYKKLWQSGSDAMFTAVEWRGDHTNTDASSRGADASPICRGRSTTIRRRTTFS